MSENITNVKLLYVPLDNEYKHTLYFENLTAQLNYFNSVSIKKSFSDFSYQRKDSKLRVNLSFDEALKYNYCMYQNTAYNNKWFFAFITDYEWKRDDVTELSLETDVMQTWLIEKEIKPSFIDREHTNDDTIGANTIPENLEMGEYYCRTKIVDTKFTEYAIVIGVTQTPEGTMYGSIYDGIYSGIIYYAFKYDKYEDTTEAVSKFIEKYKGEFDAIKCMFLYPFDLIEFEDPKELPNRVKARWDPKTYSIQLRRNDAYIDHEEAFYPYKNNVPKNKKLFCYPYSYLMVSNNNGVASVYQWEHFKDRLMAEFQVEACITPGGSIRLTPLNYKNNNHAWDEGINLGKFPICNWTSDEYTNWLTQNSVNIGLNMITGLGQIIAGAGIAYASGGLGTAVGGSQIVGGISTITGQLAQIHQMSFTPAQVNGNVNCGDVIGAAKNNKFVFSYMSIKPENMKILDEFFSAYGYKSNRIKIPFTNHRERWWYTKTVDVNILGQIPIMDKAKMKSVYDNGITFWRNASEIKNYNLSNDIL